MSGFLGNIDISTAMTIAAAIVIISCVWGSVIVTRKFYKERRFVRLMLCYGCSLILIIMVTYQWCRVVLK